MQRHILYLSAMAILALTAALSVAPIDSTDYSMVLAAPAPLSFWQQLTELGHGIVFKGRVVTVLLGLVGCFMLVMHYVIGVIPPLWLAGLDEDARYAGELRADYSRERRAKHRLLHNRVNEFFAHYDLLCTVISAEDDRRPQPTVGDSSIANALQQTAPAMARMMCCPAVAVALHDTSTPSMADRRSTEAVKVKQGGGEAGDGPTLALMLIGRPFGEDALLAAAALWLDAHPPPGAASQETSSSGDTSVRVAHSTSGAGTLPEMHAGFGTRLVGSTVCSPPCVAACRKLQWAAQLVTSRIAAAYNSQRLQGRH